MCDRSFKIAGPECWNALPVEMRAIDNKWKCIWRKLKTHLFPISMEYNFMYINWFYIMKGTDVFHNKTLYYIRIFTAF